MKIKCLGCGKRDFELNPAEVEIVKIITFVCPECGERTAISERPGGGFVIAVDTYGKETIK